MRRAFEQLHGRRYNLADEMRTINYLRKKGYLSQKEATLFRTFAEDAAIRCIPAS